MRGPEAPSSEYATMLVPLSRTLSRLPLRWLHAMGAAAGLATYALSPRYRRKVRANLRIAGLDLGPGRRRAVACEAGRAVLEAPFVWFSPSARLARMVTVHGEAILREALGAGRGVILLTPHLGCFEVVARVIAASHPLTVLFKPPRTGQARRLLEDARDHRNLRALPANAGGVRGLLRALKRGEAIGVLPDQVPSDGDGTWAPFFGRPAYTMTLPERLARSTGATVLMAVGERLPAGRGWAVRFEPLGGDASPAAINAAMERMIRACPEQYLWSYNRYKGPRGRAAPAELPDARDGGER
jgi:Kdo2-lipid IVA lauroyltransferase/acyltransferase